MAKLSSQPAPPEWNLISERIQAHTFSVQAPRPAHPERCLHCHPHYELLYITRGVREFYLGGRNHRAEAGDLMIFRPGEPHVEYAGSRSVSYFVFRFQPDDLMHSRLEFPMVKGNRPVLNLPHKQEFLSLFDRMMDEYAHPAEESPLLLGAYLVEFIVKLRRATRQTTRRKHGDPTSERVHAAMSLLQQNVSQNVDLPRLARQTFMSVSHLSHSFKERVGESPRRFQIRERIRQARALLLETDKPATQIAEQLGYQSPYFFYRQFRAKTGMTTQEFRERFRAA